MARPLTELFPVQPDTRLDPDFFNGLIREVHQRIAELQVLKQGLEAAILAAQDIALSRVNEIMGPSQTELVSVLTQVNAAFQEAEDTLTTLKSGNITTDQIIGLDTLLDDVQATLASVGRLIEKPEITAPEADAQGFIGPFAAAPYQPTDLFYGVHEVSEWQIATGADFADIVESKFGGEALTSFNPALQSAGAQLWVRVRYGSLSNWSLWSDGVTFSTPVHFVVMPEVYGGPEPISEMPIVSTSAFQAVSSLGGSATHTSTDWRVIRANDDAVVFESLADTENLTALQLPFGVLEEGTEYLFEATHNSDTAGSSLPARIRATTIEQFPIGQAEFTEAGIYSFVVPEGVSSISVVCVGAGGGAFDQAGAGGGALSYKNNISVIPGQIVSLDVGLSGSDANSGQGGPTGVSLDYFDTWVCRATGGQPGTNINNAPPGQGGTPLEGDGGGEGGDGGDDGGSGGAAGGGAGGYSGKGGKGGTSSSSTTSGTVGQPGEGGAAGGGGGGYSSGSGGGVGLQGQGPSGTGGARGTNGSIGRAGKAGSDGQDGQDSSGGTGIGVPGGDYGGAAAAGRNTSNFSIGGKGAARIIWPGHSRQFPNTRTADE